MSQNQDTSTALGSHSSKAEEMNASPEQKDVVQATPRQLTRQSPTRSNYVPSYYFSDHEDQSSKEGSSQGEFPPLSICTSNTFLYTI